MNIKIDYKTVTFKSQISCNDKTIFDNLEQTLEDCKNKRITDWIETFIDRVKEETNNDTFSIEINGCDLYEKDFIEAVLEKESHLIDYRKVDFIDDRGVRNTYKDINEFLDFALNSNEDIVKEAIKPNIERIVNIRRNKVEVPVIATMSSGKSTLLNALIGQDFLYENTLTATATTCNIKVNNSLKEFVAQAINGDTKIDETKSSSDIRKFLERWNAEANIPKYSNLKLNLEGPVKDLSSSDLELNFIDTPGPNSSKNGKHKSKTYSYLKDNQNLPIVLYVLDPQKMESNDDDTTLREISNELRRNKENLDRIIFICNKIDNEKPGENEVDEVLSSIQKFLRNYKIENPKIFPVSAEYSKFAQLKETLTYTEEGDFISHRRKFIPAPERNHPGFQLVKHAPITENQKELLNGRIQKSELDADLVYSGLAAIKLYIEDYVTNHHQKNQYKDLMGIAFKVADAIQSNLNLQKANLEEKTAEEQKKSRERNQREREELNKRKTEALLEINKIEVDKKFIEDAIRKIDQEFDRSRNKSTKRKELSPSDAKKLVEELNAIISNLRVSIKTDLVSRINTESFNYLQKLKKEVVSKFELNSPSLETKTFNADLLNKINVLDINKIDRYKRIDVEYKEHPIEVEVPSEKWYKRWFGFTDTEIRTEIYPIEKEVIEFEKFHKDVVFPMIKQINKIIEDCSRGFEKMLLDYKNSFINLVNSSFEEGIKSVYENSNKELALTNREKEVRLQKLNKIKNSISKFKIQEYNEEIYRKPAIAC